MKHIILAGGSGTRLWPFSRSSFPKQFLHFGDKESLLQKTIKRFYPVASVKDILIVTNKTYFHIAKNQLCAIDPAFQSQILVEPERKNTAPAICLAVKYFQDILHVNEDECFLVSSADHIVSPESALLSAAFEGESMVKQGHHLIFGIRPNKPETGYGYIKTGESIGSHFFQVDRFVEKPDFHKAQIYLLSGRYLWNAGIFLFHIKTFMQEMVACSPEIGRFIQGTFEEMERRFSEMPDISIDYALLERSRRLLVAPLNVTWSDVGSWDSIYDLFDKDTNQNVKLGNVLDIDTKNCLIMGAKRLISTVGLEDLLIVDTEDALFIGKKGQSQTVKLLVDEMKKRNVKESFDHLICHRPWGTYTVLQEDTRFKIKRIVVDPGKRLSLQLHHHRNEHWIVIRGTAKVSVGERQVTIQESESFFVAKSEPHRLENPGKDPLELIEVQIGEYVGEDDVVRIEERYLLDVF